MAGRVGCAEKESCGSGRVRSLQGIFRDVIFADEIARMKAEIKAEGKVLVAMDIGPDFGLSEGPIPPITLYMVHSATNFSAE